MLLIWEGVVIVETIDVKNIYDVRIERARSYIEPYIITSWGKDTQWFIENTMCYDMSGEYKRYDIGDIANRNLKSSGFTERVLSPYAGDDLVSSIITGSTIIEKDRVLFLCVDSVSYGYAPKIFGILTSSSFFRPTMDKINSLLGVYHTHSTPKRKRCSLYDLEVW